MDLVPENTSSTRDAISAIVRNVSNRRRSRSELGSSKSPVTPVASIRPSSHVNEEVIDALNSVITTPFETSFISRLQGTKSAWSPAPVAVDWDTISPWMRLMSEVRQHFALASGDSVLDHSMESDAPIIYTTLQPEHLPQVHDLLERVFWSGIDVSDSMDYVPEKATIVATYKKLVVGIAILSSPLETYITYLAVKAGWDKAQIAKNMLYHLISRNPKKDITLHVSANNSAMLLYNQFGFKAEEFVVGFYDDYLDPLSRASKNAFKLRLRQ